MKAAQRFIAGGFRSGDRISPRSGRLKEDLRSRLPLKQNRSPRETLNLSRPFYGLLCKFRLDPSTKSAGLFSSRPLADEADINVDFHGWGKHRSRLAAASYQVRPERLLLGGMRLLSLATVPAVNESLSFALVTLVAGSTYDLPFKV